MNYEVVKTGSLDVSEKKHCPKRGSKYDALLKVLGTLKVGESVPLPLNGLKARTVITKLYGAISRSGLKPPKGCKFQSRTMPCGEQLAFSVVKKRP